MLLMALKTLFLSEIMLKLVFFVLIPQFCYCKEIYKVSFNVLENDHDLDKLSKVLQTDGSLVIFSKIFTFIASNYHFVGNYPTAYRLYQSYK